MDHHPLFSAFFSDDVEEDIIVDIETVEPVAALLSRYVCLFISIEFKLIRPTVRFP